MNVKGVCLLEGFGSQIEALKIFAKAEVNPFFLHIQIEDLNMQKGLERAVKNVVKIVEKRFVKRSYFNKIKTYYLTIRGGSLKNIAKNIIPSVPISKNV